MSYHDEKLLIKVYSTPIYYTSFYSIFPLSIFLMITIKYLLLFYFTVVFAKQFKLNKFCITP